MKHTLIAIGFALFLCVPSWAADRIRIGYSSISGSYLGLWVARDAGLFAREGLDDQMILIPSGSQLAQVVIAGEVDIAALNGSSAMAAALQGADLKVVGNTTNRLIFSIYVRPEIKTIEALKGKKIGVTRFGSATDIAARYALRKHNLDPQKDVNILQMGAMSSIMGGLQGGSIDAGLVSPPTLFAVEKFGFKELVNVTDMDIAFPNPSLVVQGDIMKKKPDLVDKFLRAYARAIHRARTDREMTFRSIAKYTKIADSFVLQKAYDLYVGKVLEKAPYINMAGMRNALDDLAKTVPAAKDAKPEQFIDMGYLDRLEKSGLLKELYR
ncbi:MAG: ABC transporter substrate-binding protein [Deltaproteobacteria bacterium]|nr:ABC transporter substrate-binding protein [Deltaproteobacteria bacterium]MBI2180726.1 ABC transporter substrate-binding protein [Deltaproteobacteria bacterium]MBI2231799.1 ABC transporter substrate-binding protein [Deltaproteobacteria bacterium]MBI2533850.1 ABC transporter substrate-binding protein [Deltaproteobacteria bacterium]MBI3064179.1 ABC transporter substrate-binding protein [Deltaproteobacteria bacterium]